MVFIKFINSLELILLFILFVLFIVCARCIYILFYRLLDILHKKNILTDNDMNSIDSIPFKHKEYWKKKNKDKIE